ncbi:MAG: glycoside hydrolase, partial [Ilumatobacteraceae bacterium]|nr:glycoside hydrolase [Ilumatobacteraceae bacterium]
FSFSASPALASVPPWSAPVTVADAYGDAKASAVAPDGTITIATETAAGIATVTSTDAGATWAPAVLVGSGGEFAFRPAIGVTSSGLLAASWVEETAGVRAIYVVISANNGAIWSAPVALPTVISSVDDPVVASSSASGFTIAWSEGFDKLASSSVDAGVTWSAAQVLTQAMNSYGTTSLIPHGVGQIVVIFQEFDGLTALYSIQSKRSSDGGVSWGAIVPVSGSWSGSLGNGLYAVGVSPSAGNVVAVWSRGVIGGDGLFATTSSDGGATWDSPFSVFSPADSLRYFDVQEISATSAGVVWHYELGADSVLGYSTVDIGASAASAPVTINHTLTSYYDRLPSLSTLDSVRVVSWYEDGATEATSGYRVSASCDAGVTWTAPSALAIGPDISSASAVTVVSGSVFTGLWGEQDSGPSGQSLRAASSSDPCAAVAAANPMLATTGVEITPLVIFALAMFSLGAGLHALRRRSAV